MIIAASALGAALAGMLLYFSHRERSTRQLKGTDNKDKNSLDFADATAGRNTKYSMG